MTTSAITAESGSSWKERSALKACCPTPAPIQVAMLSTSMCWVSGSWSSSVSARQETAKAATTDPQEIAIVNARGVGRRTRASITPW